MPVHQTLDPAALHGAALDAHIDPATLTLRLIGLLVGAGGIAWATLVAKAWYDARKLRLDAKAQSDRNALDKDAHRQKADADERDDRRDDFKATIDGLNRNIGGLQDQLRQQQENSKQVTDGLQRQITDQGAEISAQKREMRSLQEQIDALREERIGLLEQISALEMAKAAEKGRADAAERVVADRDEQICRLREEAVKRERTIRDLKADLRRARDGAGANREAVPRVGQGEQP